MQAKSESNQTGDSFQALKTLSYLLQVAGPKEDLTIDSDGFASIDDIASKSFFKSRGLDSQKIQSLALNSNLQHLFQLKTLAGENGQTMTYIKMSRNQSSDDGQKIENPADISLCVHETCKDGWKFIKTEGLASVTRDPFEFRTTQPPAGNKDDEIYDMFIEIDAGKAMQDGIEFFRRKDNTIISRGLEGAFPAKYFRKAFIRVKGKNLVEVDLTAEPKKKGAENKQQDKKGAIEEKKELTIDTNPNLRGNHFKYLCVLDFEAQCSDNVQLKVQEIIEFPVVIVDVEQMAIMETFHYYVKPVEYPQIFPFCTELTGITQDKVDNGLLLEKVLEELDTFLKEKGVLDSSFCFVTCGDWDLNICLRKETKTKNLPVRSYLKRWINIKKVYPLPSGDDNRKFGMTALLKMSHLELIGRHHSGIDDAMNIARVVEYLLKKDFQFKTSMVAQVSY